eukprot:scaffold195673_cov31-Tisochrysis_lutea.AAC.1
MARVRVQHRRRPHLPAWLGRLAPAWLRAARVSAVLCGFCPAAAVTGRRTLRCVHWPLKRCVAWAAAPFGHARQWASFGAAARRGAPWAVWAPVVPVRPRPPARWAARPPATVAAPAEAARTAVSAACAAADDGRHTPHASQHLPPWVARPAVAPEVPCPAAAVAASHTVGELRVAGPEA